MHLSHFVLKPLIHMVYKLLGYLLHKEIDTAKYTHMHMRTQTKLLLFNHFIGFLQ